MPFQIIRNDITKAKTDAIVNTANPQPVYASGTDAAVYQAAGAEALLHERQKIGRIERGEVAVTSGFALAAKYIIHTVGPAWIDGKHGEFETLAACYRNSLELAAALRCESIAFPLIATGVYGFPKDKALDIAVSVIRSFLKNSDMMIWLVVFDRQAFVLSGQLFRDVDAYVDDNYVCAKQQEEILDIPDADGTDRRGMPLRKSVEEREALSDAGSHASPAIQSKKNTAQPAGSASLEDVLENVGDTFQQKLLQWIDARGLTDPEVYKNANLDRKLFSKIRSNVNYKPKKRTALALAIALKLDLEETSDLLNRAELAFSPGSKFDLILQYFIGKREYDIDKINLALFEHNQPLLGA